MWLLNFGQHASPCGLCILHSFYLTFLTFCLMPSYFIIYSWPTYSILFLACLCLLCALYVFLFRFDCLTLGLYALFLACMPSILPLSVCLYIDLTALLLAYMPCSWPVYALQFATVCISLYRLDCLPLGLYSLFFACMPSSSPLSVCLYIDLTALLLAYMPCSCHAL